MNIRYIKYIGVSIASALMATLTLLPDEIICMIYDYVTHSVYVCDVVSLSSVCHRLHDCVPRHFLDHKKNMSLVSAELTQIKYYYTSSVNGRNSHVGCSIRIINGVLCIHRTILAFYPKRINSTTDNMSTLIIYGKQKCCIRDKVFLEDKTTHSLEFIMPFMAHWQNIDIEHANMIIRSSKYFSRS